MNNIRHPVAARNTTCALIDSTVVRNAFPNTYRQLAIIVRDRNSSMCFANFCSHITLLSVFFKSEYWAIAKVKGV